MLGLNVLEQYQKMLKEPGRESNVGTVIHLEDVARHIQMIVRLSHTW